MTLFKYLKVIVFICLCHTILSSQIAPDVFSIGEEVTYKVYYNWKFVWVPAGEVTFKTLQDDSSYILNVEGMSYESYDSFFKVRDFYQSMVDKESLLPTHFCRYISEGSYTCFDSMAFDRKKNIVHERFGKNRDSAKDFYYSVDRKVLDMVSAIYFFRSIKFDSLIEGEEIPFSIFFDKELLNLDIQFKGISRKKIKSLGRVTSWHLQADLIGGNIFNKGDVMDIWVSDDGNNLPLLIESPIKYGSVKAIIKSVKGTKYNFDYILND